MGALDDDEESPPPSRWRFVWAQKSTKRGVALLVAAAVSFYGVDVSGHLAAIQAIVEGVFAIVGGVWAFRSDE